MNDMLKSSVGSHCKRCKGRMIDTGITVYIPLEPDSPVYRCDLCSRTCVHDRVYRKGMICPECEKERIIIEADMITGKAFQCPRCDTWLAYWDWDNLTKRQI